MISYKAAIRVSLNFNLSVIMKKLLIIRKDFNLMSYLCQKSKYQKSNNKRRIKHLKIQKANRFQ
jgi:hypothetical protein